MFHGIALWGSRPFRCPAAFVPPQTQPLRSMCQLDATHKSSDYHCAATRTCVATPLLVDLAGHILQALTRLPALTVLDLDGNQLTGERVLSAINR